MKRHVLTPEERLWQQVWRTWPHAMQYECVELPFDAPGRASDEGINRSRAWLAAKRQRRQESEGL